MKYVEFTIARSDTGAVLPFARVTVYQSDGATVATVYNSTGGSIANPITADVNGKIGFAAADADYILAAVSADGTLTLPKIRVQVYDFANLAGNVIAAATTVNAISGILASPLTVGSPLPFCVTAISGGIGTGTGGTNGTYALGVTGGPAGFAATVTIAGGAISGYTITNTGLATTNAVPTLSLAGVPGLTGATVPTATVGTIPVGRTFWAPSSDGTQLLAWQNSAGALAANGSPQIVDQLSLASQVAQANAAANAAAVNAANSQLVLTGAVNSGDPVFVVIRPDGFTAQVYWKGFKQGGTTGALNPASTTPLFTMQVVDLGFDNNGNVVNRTRTVVGTVQLRQPYPNAGLPVDTQDTSGASRVFALSEPVFQKSQIGYGNAGWQPLASFAQGVYVDNGTGGSSASSNPKTLYCVNNSTLAYPAMVANWACPAYQRAGSGGSWTFEFAADNQYGFNGCPFAYAVATVTDGTHTSTGSTTTLQQSSQVVRTDPVAMVGKITVPIGSIADGLRTVNLKVYPWLGTAPWDSSLQGNTWRTPMPCDLPCVADAAGNYVPVYACLNTSTGNDGTGVASTTRATAEAAPFLTWAAARAALKTANNARGHNDHAAAVMLLSQDIAGFGETLNTTITEGIMPFVVDTKSGITAQTIGITEAGTSANKQCAKTMQFNNLYIRNTTNTYVLDGVVDGNTPTPSGTNPATYYIFNNCKFSASSNTNSSPLFYQVGLIDFVNCLVSDCTANFMGAYSLNRTYYRLHIGVTQTSTLTTIAAMQAITAIGSTYQSAAWADWDAAVYTNLVTPDNVIHWNCKFLYLPGQPSYCGGSTTPWTKGLVVAQCIFENYLNGNVTPAFWISADSRTIEDHNLISRHNTAVGARTNMFYNSKGTVALYKTGVDQYSLHETYNIKRDTFSGDGGFSANRIGTWIQSFGCGMFGRHAVTGATGSDPSPGGTGNATTPGTDSWLGEYMGKYSTYVATVTFTNNKSYTGAGGGGGNYLPTGTLTNLINKVEAGRAVYPFDIRNAARKNTGTGSCGAYEVG
jgi:hypothetical protein